MFEDFTEWTAGRAMRSKGRRLAASTLHAYETRLRGVAKQAGVASSEELCTVLADRGAWDGLLDKLYARQAPKTVAGNVMTLRLLGDYAVARGIIPAHSITKADTPLGGAATRRPVVVYSEMEIAQLLLHARYGGNLRLWMLLVSLTETGRRVGEMLKLRFVDMKLDAKPAHFDLPTTKSRKQQYVPLSKLLREEVWTERNIERLQASGNARYTRDPSVFPFPWSYRNSFLHMKKLCVAADVEFRAFHVFRHTRATQLIARGVPIAAVSSLIGHAHVSTTDAIYSHVTALDFSRYQD